MFPKKISQGKFGRNPTICLEIIGAHQNEDVFVSQCTYTLAVYVSYYYMSERQRGFAHKSYRNNKRTCEKLMLLISNKIKKSYGLQNIMMSNSKHAPRAVSNVYERRSKAEKRWSIYYNLKSSRGNNRSPKKCANGGSNVRSLPERATIFRCQFVAFPRVGDTFRRTSNLSFS